MGLVSLGTTVCSGYKRAVLFFFPIGVVLCTDHREGSILSLSLHSTQYTHSYPTYLSTSSSTPPPPTRPWPWSQPLGLTFSRGQRWSILVNIVNITLELIT